MSATIAGYHIKEQIYESRHSLVYRACQGEENLPVILKMLKQAYPPPKKIAAFKREYELTRSLRLAGVIRAYSLATDQHRPVMVLEDFGGESLTWILQSRRFSLDEILSLALRIADILGQVHRHQVTHNDVNPSNLILNPTTGQLKLIDFGIATRLARENLTPSHPIGLEGTLAYMSPEQTGRMNRAVDYRTDFYSIGVTLYELLTGRLPFPITDALALVHAHIAQQPPSPHEIVPDVPHSLSAIVMKLLAKNAKDRYQSAEGLIADLEECLRQWRTSGEMTTFPLGQQDVMDWFHIPQKLYGREREIDTLLDAFTRVSKGACELMLMSGQAGVGKTALVQELYKSFTLRHGYFIAGKFDQFQKNTPYASLVQAFRSLIRQILTESEEQIAAWRTALTAAVGANLQVVIDVVPEVELVVGQQPMVSSLPSVEARNRFHLAFQNFIHVFTGPGHPLVLFLDDLQWADTASLQLLRLLMTAPENRSLLVICAYRDNEVTGGHPVQVTLDNIRGDGGTVSHVALRPLRLLDVQQITADTLTCSLETATPLAELVFTKTAGNPFFIGELLKSLYTAHLLSFEERTGEWRWDVAHIRARNITDNVVELMVDRMQKLGAETQEVLKLAACLGNQFNLRTLATVHEKPVQEIARNLWPALREELVLPLSDTYKLVDLTVQELDGETLVEYKFAHDKIQQAAYSLISEADRQAVHWRVGQLLLHSTPRVEQGSRIFAIVNHLNLGRESIQHDSEQSELATLNLQAGKRAKVAAAYEPAFRYLQTGMELLAQDAWERQYDLALTLHVEAAEVAYLGGDFQQMNHLTAIALQRAKTLLDKIKAYEVMLHSYSAQNKLVEGVKTGLQVLAILGERFPSEPNQADILHGLEKTQQTLAGRRVEELIHLPVMTDPYAIAAIRILAGMIHLSFAAFPRLFPLIVFRMVHLSVIHGNAPLSAHAYATYGIILCAAGEIEAGYQFGSLASHLVERLNVRELKASVTYMVQTFIRHWKEHLSLTLQPLLEGYQTGLETGDLMFGALDVQGYCFQSYWLGTELTELEREMKKYSEIMHRLKQDPALNINEIYRQVVLNLLDRSADPCLLIGESYNEEEALLLRLRANDANTMCFIYSSKLVLSYLFHKYSQAVEYAEIAEKYLEGLLGTAAIPGFHLYDSLARLAVFSEAREAERETILEKVTANQRKMNLWAQHAPMNYLHKFHLVEAERARVAGNDRDAREFYDLAIDLAREHGFVHEEALANELAANFYLARGQTRLAYYYLREAHYAYTRWGATAKVKDMDLRYPKFWTSADMNFSRNLASTTSSNTEHYSSSAFDFTSVIKASQAISREIVLDQLLTSLMKILIENTGAQRGLLLLEREGHLVIEAEGALAGDAVTLWQSVPVETSADIPLAIIHYVERTKESVVLSEAMQEPVFANDPYFIKRRPKSILCVPLIKQGKLIGIVYLENNLTTGAFTADRLAIVNVLAAEAVISIENARLYQSLEKAGERLTNYSKILEHEVEERTRELQEKNRELEIANQQVLEANRRKSQFLAGMSHQLRTPMNAILGFTRLVLRRAGDQLPERQHENLTKVKESAENLLILINDLLDLSKIEAGRMEVHPARFTVPSFIQSCCESVIPLVKPEVRLRHEVSSEVGEAHTDEDGLRQVLLNLLSNAIKFTHTGEVVVRAWVKQPNSADPFLVMTVSDTGVGILPHAVSRIFEEFQQVDSGPQKQEGTGLGLPIAKRWVELLGGTITLESELGKGSTFTVTIPITYQPQRTTPAESVGI